MYKVQTPSKIILRADANRDSHVSKIKGGYAASSINPEEGRTGNCKTKNQSLQERRQPVQIKDAFCMDPDTPPRSVKYSKNTPSITPHNGHAKKMNPALAAKQSVVSPTSLIAASRKPTS